MAMFDGSWWNGWWWNELTRPNGNKNIPDADVDYEALAVLKREADRAGAEAFKRVMLERFKDKDDEVAQENLKLISEKTGLTQKEFVQMYENSEEEFFYGDENNNLRFMPGILEKISKKD